MVENIAKQKYDNKNYMVLKHRYLALNDRHD